MQKRTMVWNTQKKTWEYSTEDRLFGQWEPFLGTWPTSGMMQDGRVCELPMQVPPTIDSESSSLPIFPTPVASEGIKAPAQQTSEKKGKTGQVWLSNIAKDLEPVLPTPTVSDNRGASRGEVEGGNPKYRLKVEVELLPTTRTSMSNGPTQKEIAAGNPKTRIETEVMLGETNWGKFEPAIQRWENILGRPAPAPTKPDGRDGAHRLSSSFTEWMMGLESGWVTDVGLSRNQELKACGNGVVPQQAEMALRILLESISPDWREMLEETNI